MIGVIVIAIKYIFYNQELIFLTTEPFNFFYAGQMILLFLLIFSSVTLLTYVSSEKLDFETECIPWKTRQVKSQKNIYLTYFKLKEVFSCDKCTICNMFCVSQILFLQKSIFPHAEKEPPPTTILVGLPPCI